MIVQQRIAQYLVQKGIKQKFLCDKTGIKQVKMSNLMNARIKLSADDFELICKALGEKPDQFIHID